jgi:hypothetical protein
MNVKQLKELLEGHKDETEIKLGGWVNHLFLDKYKYDYHALEDKHFTFDKNINDKVTILIELDV